MRLSSFIVGIGVGAGVALLLAPRSGDETREILTDKVEEGRRLRQTPGAGVPRPCE